MYVCLSSPSDLWNPSTRDLTKKKFDPFSERTSGQAVNLIDITQEGFT